MAIYTPRVMLKNAFTRSALVAICALGLCCCGGGGGGGGSSSTGGINAGNLIPETASDFTIEADFLGFELDFDCDNIVFKHSSHAAGACPGNCHGTITSTSRITILAKDINGTEKRREYQNVSGSWDVTFTGDYYVLSFYNMKNNGTDVIGNITINFRAHSVNEGAERVVYGNVIGGHAEIAGYTGTLGGVATIRTQPSTAANK